MMTAGQYRTAAMEACCLVAIPSVESDKDVPSFDLRELPEGLRRAAAALMFSASAHMLMRDRSVVNPEAMFNWSGHWWFLRQWTKGRLHISPCDGGVGLLTAPWTVF